MKNKDLMKAVGDIDDKYIEEAPASVKKKRIPKISGFVRDGGWTRWAGAVAALLVLVLVGHFIFPGFNLGGSKKADDYVDPGYYYTSDNYTYEQDAAVASDSYSYSLGNRKNQQINYQSAQAPGGSAAEPADAPPISNNTTTVYNASNVKLIYRATVSAQTVDFATADAQLREMVLNAGGYFEGQTISNGSYYNGDYLKKASYTIRIPAEKFEEFLSGLKEGITVKSISQTAEDVGLQYAETENRLETLKIKLGRLQDLLRQASNMSDIIELESAISDTEEEIDYYTNTLNRYDSLIGFSTITLDLTEVARPGSGIEEKEGFFKKLWNEFVDGLENAGEGFANFFYWISYNFVGLIIFGAIVFCLIKFRPFTKLFKKLFKKEQK